MTQVEKLIAENLGTWTEAEWQHEVITDGEVVTDEYGTIYCSGIHKCDICLAVERDAEQADDHAKKALKLIRDGHIVSAIEEIKEARALELQYGDAPTWGAVYEAMVREYA